MEEKGEKEEKDVEIFPTNVRFSKDKYCLNCNKRGHSYKFCYCPINSYGCIIYSIFNHEIHYLAIQKKYTPFFIEIILAKYIKHNKFDYKYLKRIISFLPQSERNLILENVSSFSKLWESLEKSLCESATRNKYNHCKYYFDMVEWEKYLTPPIEDEGKEEEEGGRENTLFIDFDSSLNTERRNEAYWEFPKGYRNKHETNIECAVRECCEELDCKSSDISVLKPSMRIKITFQAINDKTYCTNYYIAEVNPVLRNQIETDDEHIHIMYKPYDNRAPEQNGDKKIIQKNKEVRDIKWLKLSNIKKLMIPAIVDIFEEEIHNKIKKISG